MPANMGAMDDILGAGAADDILGTGTMNDILGASTMDDILGASTMDDILGTAMAAPMASTKRQMRPSIKYRTPRKRKNRQKLSYWPMHKTCLLYTSRCV